uniref:Uncharacterized protein n=1 Tax=Nelumbo nucifera TaxID=4432 RepID=A0A822YXG5_NELNU|nr:TPA_asm: hypothetical protein HUJ06_006659 [Nelumbo nucifera]
MNKEHMKQGAMNQKKPKLIALIDPGLLANVNYLNNKIQIQRNNKQQIKRVGETRNKKKVHTFIFLRDSTRQTKKQEEKPEIRNQTKCFSNKT